MASLGPRRKRHKKFTQGVFDPHYYTKASDCKVTKADGSVVIVESYSPVSLQSIVKVRANIKSGTRVALYRRDKGRCRYCNAPVSSLDWEPDHVVPIALGGSNRMSNLVVSCVPCNRTKGANVWKPKPVWRGRACD